MIFLNEDKTELIATCNCGCDNSIHIRLDDDFKRDYDADEFAFMTYMKGDDTMGYKGGKLYHKFRKLWYILRGKDYCYSDVIMTKNDVEQLRDYLSSVLNKYYDN